MVRNVLSKGNNTEGKWTTTSDEWHGAEVQWHVGIRHRQSLLMALQSRERTTTDFFSRGFAHLLCKSLLITSKTLVFRTLKFYKGTSVNKGRDGSGTVKEFRSGLPDLLRPLTCLSSVNGV